MLLEPGRIQRVLRRLQATTPRADRLRRHDNGRT
jgi:hypothetical protein